MQGIAIKFCGLNTPESVGQAARLGADYAGFVIFPASPRHVTPARAAQLAAALPNRVQTVAVTVNLSDAEAQALFADFTPDWLQLHGEETPARGLELKNLYNTRLIRAFSLRNAEDLQQVGAWETIADALLFDAKAPADSPLPGGNGVAFDWRLVKGLDTRLPWFLSGGLDAANIAHALAVSGARAVDVSSGIESAKGVKDSVKMEAFAQAVSSYRKATA